MGGQGEHGERVRDIVRGSINDLRGVAGVGIHAGASAHEARSCAVVRCPQDAAHRRAEQDRSRKGAYAYYRSSRRRMYK